MSRWWIDLPPSKRHSVGPRVGSLEPHRDYLIRAIDTLLTGFLPMADIINPRRARKAKARAEKEAEASENRARFGRPGREQMSTAATRGLQGRKRGAHRRDGPGEDPAGDDGAA